MILRHPNGRGELRDDAEANRATYISRDSSASGQAKLRDCRLMENSHATGKCQIYGGRLVQNSFVTGSTIVAGKPLIRNSYIDCSEVSGRTHIGGAKLLGTTEVCDRAIIINATARDAIVYGECDIDGDFEFTGRVHEGYWTRPPKHIKLPWIDISECVDGKVLLNCYCRKSEFWIRHGPRVAAKWGWSQDMIDVTIATIEREFVFASGSSATTPSVLPARLLGQRPS